MKIYKIRLGQIYKKGSKLTHIIRSIITLFQHEQETTHKIDFETYEQIIQH